MRAVRARLERRRERCDVVRSVLRGQLREQRRYCVLSVRDRQRLKCERRFLLPMPLWLLRAERRRAAVHAVRRWQRVAAGRRRVLLALCGWHLLDGRRGLRELSRGHEPRDHRRDLSKRLQRLCRRIGSACRLCGMRQLRPRHVGLGGRGCVLALRRRQLLDGRRRGVHAMP